MRIEHIEVINLLFRYAPGTGFRYAGGQATGRVTSLIKVRCEGGLTGWGSVYSHPDLVRMIVEGQLAPVLLGRDAREVETLWEMMYGLTRWYGRKGVALSALGGVDMALWDLRGKHQGQPLWQLLKAPRDAVPAYASALLWREDLTDLETEAARHVSNGFRRMKMRLGGGEAYDVPALEVVQKGAGKGAEVLVDGSQRYTLAEAVQLVGVLAEKKVFWFEEPFPPEAIDDFTALRREAGLPLAAGENEFGLQGFRELARAGAVDILQPDACRTGGITESLQVFALAREHSLRVAPHTWSDAIALLANAHLVAAHSNGITVEVDQTGNPFIDQLIPGGLTVRDGLLHLPQAPGLGVEPDPKILAEYQMPAGELVPDGSYSDMMFGVEYLPPDFRKN